MGDTTPGEEVAKSLSALSAIIDLDVIPDEISRLVGILSLHAVQPVHGKIGRSYAASLSANWACLASWCEMVKKNLHDEASGLGEKEPPSSGTGT